MTDTATFRRARAIGLGVVLVTAFAIDVGVLRSVLGGRDVFLVRFSGRLLPFALAYALGLVAAIVHLGVLARRPLLSDDVPARDARRLLVGSGMIATAYLAMHAVLGPLGTVLRGGDAFTLYASLRAGFPTHAVAVLHAMGLVAVGAHLHELTRELAPRSGRARYATLAVVVALVHGGLAVDPIALLTVGKTLLGRLPEPATVILPVDSATVSPR